jgi:predicted transcriptional regulator
MPHSVTDVLCSICCCIPLASDEIYEKEYKETKISMMMKSKRMPPKITLRERLVTSTANFIDRFSKDSSKKYQLRSSYSPKTLANKIKSVYFPELETIPSASGDQLSSKEEPRVTPPKEKVD